MSKIVAKEFWTTQTEYPEYGTIKQRRLHELQYIVPKLSGNTLLDLGCGDGALLNCLVELTDFKSLSYNGIFSILVKAVQEQDAVIQDLKTRLEALEG